MEIFFCIMLFCMGSVFGSFFTLAVYRIPLGLDITHERSMEDKKQIDKEEKEFESKYSYKFKPNEERKVNNKGKSNSKGK